MIRKQVIAGAAVFAAAAGSILGIHGRQLRPTAAYFTDREFHTNIYTFGDVTADGTETEWNPKDTPHLLPQETVKKNPQLVNTGDNAAIGFIVLDSPLLKEAVLSDEHGQRIHAENKELWTYLSEGKAQFADGWILLESGYADSGHHSVSDAEQAAFKRRIFGWKDSLAGRNGTAYESTAPLFDEIQAVNYVEGSLKEADLHGIDVYFLAVQADNLQLEDGTVTTAGSAKNMNESVLKMIWKIAGSNAEFEQLPDADNAHRLDLHGSARETKGGE